MRARTGGERQARIPTLSPALVLAGVAATAFVSTNIDALLMLVANAARAPRSRNTSAAGFLAATALVLAGAWLLATASRIIPPTRTGLVGVVPLVMGLRQLFILVRRAARARARASSPTFDAPPSSRVPSDSLGFGEALLLHLSMSADNLAVYAALLSDTLPPLRPLVVATTLALGLLWTGLARAAMRVPGLSPVLLRRGHALMAWLLIAVGLYILLDTDTDVLLPRAGRHGAVSPPG